MSGRNDGASNLEISSIEDWEMGDLELLKLKKNEIRKRVNSIVWISPHADYRPEVLGMRVALPFVDYFAGLDAFTDRGKFLRIFGGTFREEAEDPRYYSLRTSIEQEAWN